MDARLNSLAGELRRRPASEATEWLLREYPLTSHNWGEALTLIGHCSFPRREAKRLAAYYLSRAPYASDRPYVLFAKLLGVAGFLDVLAGVDIKSDDRALLLYHLQPILRAAKGKRDPHAVSAFMRGLSDLIG